MPRELKEGLAPAPAQTPATSVDPGSSKSLPDLHAFEAVVLITIWLVLRLLQLIVGPMRCRSGHWLVQYGAMAAYYLPTPVAFSAASAIGCQVISVKDALDQCNKFPAECTVDPDICLSYSLCHLVARRYFEFRCAEEGNAEIRHFALTQLLPNYKRAFTIVEVQLAFLHDHLFARYHYAMSNNYMMIENDLVLSVIIGVILTGSFLFSVAFLSHGLLAGKTTNLDEILVPQLLPLGSLVMALTHPALPKHWCRISNVLMYCSAETSRVHVPSVIEWHVQSIRRNACWRDQIGQYSLVKDYGSRSFKKAFVALIKEFVLSEQSHKFIKHHPVEEEDVSVPDKVRELVARTLRDMDGLPTSVTRSLWRNRNLVLGDLFWTCRQETHTHTILIWHIATCYLDMFPLVDTGNTCNREIATTLSKYCAYLVAFCPEFLPEHSMTTKVLLQQVLEEAKEMLGRKPMFVDMKRIRIHWLELPEDQASQTTFEKGIRLARQLEELDPLVCWKAVAEFWAETILYVAPSGNAEAHVEQLAKGGEFVTHLWALLHNAGFLKRATEEWSPPQPELPVESSSHHNSREELRLRRSQSLRTF